MNKPIADMLSLCVDAEHRTWDVVPPYITFAYNTTKQETTRMTPFRILYGGEVSTMLDAMLRHDSKDDAAPSFDFTQRAENARQIARQRIRQQQHFDAASYNIRHRHVRFVEGDKVWIRTPVRRRGLSEKLLRRFFGTYTVQRKLSWDTRYRYYSGLDVNKTSESKGGMQYGIQTDE